MDTFDLPTGVARIVPEATRNLRVLANLLRAQESYQVGDATDPLWQARLLTSPCSCYKRNHLVLPTVSEAIIHLKEEWPHYLRWRDVADQVEKFELQAVS